LTAAEFGDNVQKPNQGHQIFFERAQEFNSTNVPEIARSLFARKSLPNIIIKANNNLRIQEEMVEM